MSYVIMFCPSDVAVTPLTQAQFVPEVTEASAAGYVIVALYIDSHPACALLLKCLEEFARKHKDIKWWVEDGVWYVHSRHTANSTTTQLNRSSTFISASRITSHPQVHIMRYEEQWVDTWPTYPHPHLFFIPSTPYYNRTPNRVYMSEHNMYYVISCWYVISQTEWHEKEAGLREPETHWHTRNNIRSWHVIDWWDIDHLYHIPHHVPLPIPRVFLLLHEAVNIWDEMSDVLVCYAMIWYHSVCYSID